MVSKSGCRRWLSDRTNLEKTLMSISLVFLITLVLVVLFGISYKGSSTVERTEEEVTCQTNKCIKTAGRILTMMNSNADPCSDFYQYACGRFTDTYSPVSVAQTGLDKVYFLFRGILEHGERDVQHFEKAKTFYQTCMKFGSHAKDPAASLTHLMSEWGLGTWPVLDNFWSETVSVEHWLTTLSLLGVHFAFRFEIVPDPQKPGAYINRLSPGGPLWGDSDVYKNDIFKSYLMSVLGLLGVPDHKINSRADEILSEEKHFYNIHQKVSCDIDELKILLPADEALSELERILPGMNWTAIMPVLWRSFNVDGPFPVEIHCRQKIKDYASRLKDVSVGTTFTYLGWRFLAPFVGQLEPAFRKLEWEFETNRSGVVNINQDTWQVPEYMYRWRECVDFVVRYMGSLLAEGVAQKFDDERTVQKVEAMANGVKESLSSFLTSSAWLGQWQKKKLKQKVSEVVFQSATWKTPRRTEEIDSWFSKLDIDGESHIRNVIRLQNITVFHEMRRLLSEEMSIRTKNFSLTTPRQFEHYGNTIGLYYDKLQAPYFMHDMPNSLSYGGLSVFLARQLSYFLIDQNLGSTVGDETSLWDTWSSSNIASGCLLNEFSDYLTDDGNLKVDGNEKIRELFLDHSALQLAYAAFKNQEGKELDLPGLDLSNDQKFFLAYAQAFCEHTDSSTTSDHIPTGERINSALRDSEPFAEAFSCARATPMNTGQRCPIWR